MAPPSAIDVDVHAVTDTVSTNKNTKNNNNSLTAPFVRLPSLYPTP